MRIFRRGAIACLGIVGGLSTSAYADLNLPEPASLPSPALLPVCVTVFETQCGLLDRKGHWVVQPTYGEISASDDVWIVQTRGGLTGVLDKDGHELIAPRFDVIGRFLDGVAPATTHDNAQYGFIDRQGQWVMPQRYAIAGEFVGGWAAVATEVADTMHSTFIDRQGHTISTASYDSVEAFRFGFAQVEQGSDEQRTVGLIDRSGKLVLPFSKERVHVEAVMSDRILDEGNDSVVLRDGQGHALFTAKGINGGSDERAFYMLDDKGVGLLDLRSGKSLLAPRPTWHSGNIFADGVAWVSVGLPDGHDGFVLVDRQGHELVAPATYESVGRFSEGVAPVMRQGSPPQLIDHHGRVLAQASGDPFEPAWKSDSQTPRYGDVWTYDMRDNMGNATRTIWVDNRGEKLVSVEPYPCGIQVVRNGSGEIIWPKDVDASCLVKKHEFDSDPITDDKVSAERIEKVQQDKAKESLTWSNDAAQRDINGGVSDIIGAQEHRVPLKLLGDPAWQVGPKTIRLEGPASLDLPEGFRYLSPTAVRELAKKSGALVPDTDDSLPLAIIAPNDGSWSMRVLLLQQGHVPTEGFSPDAESLRQTMETRSTNILGQLNNPRPTIHNISWLREPRWDAAAHRLDWSYEDMTIGSDMGRVAYVSSVSLGRTWSFATQLELDGLGDSKDLLLLAQPAIDRISAGVKFDAGEAYADAKAGDPASKLGLAEYVTGPPTPEMEAFPDKLASAQRERAWHEIITRILPALALVAGAVGVTVSRRKNK